MIRYIYIPVIHLTLLNSILTFFSRSSVTSNCWKFAAVRGVTNIYPQKFNMVHPKNDGFPKPESPIPGCHFQVHVGFRGSILKPPFFVVFFTNAFTGWSMLNFGRLTGVGMCDQREKVVWSGWREGNETCISWVGKICSPVSWRYWLFFNYSMQSKLHKESFQMWARGYIFATSIKHLQECQGLLEKKTHHLCMVFPFKSTWFCESAATSEGQTIQIFALISSPSRRSHGDVYRNRCAAAYHPRFGHRSWATCAPAVSAGRWDLEIAGKDATSNVFEPRVSPLDSWICLIWFFTDFTAVNHH